MLNAISIDELKAYFASKEFPRELQLSQGVKIVDMAKFLETQFLIAQTHSGSIVLIAPEKLIRVKRLLDGD